MAQPIISVRNLSKLYPLGQNGEANLHIFRDLFRPLFSGNSLSAGPTPATGTPEGMFWALNDINFEIGEGERVGIIGRNGAGKSTLLKILSRVVYPTSGEALIRGRVTSLLEVGTGFNDNLSGRENVYLNASFHGLTRAEIDERFEEIVDFSEIEKFLDMPLRHYSTGMRSRLAFSVAAHLDPDILILDEVLAVGDLAFQLKCLDRVKSITSSIRALLFVSHSMGSIGRYCDRCIWLHEGGIVQDGEAVEVAAAYSGAMFELRSSVSFDSDAEKEEPESKIGALNNVSTTTTLAESSGPAAELIKAKISDESGTAKALFSVDSKIKVSFEYRVIGSGLMVPGISLLGSDGELVFWSVPTDTEIEIFQKESGVYQACCWLPENLLNVGKYSLTITVVSPDQSPMKRHFVAEHVLTFQTIEAVIGAKSARGILPRAFPGPIRPALKWQEEIINIPYPSKN